MANLYCTVVLTRGGHYVKKNHFMMLGDIFIRQNMCHAYRKRNTFGNNNAIIIL